MSHSFSPVCKAISSVQGATYISFSTASIPAFCSIPNLSIYQLRPITPYWPTQRSLLHNLKQLMQYPQIELLSMSVNT